MNLSGWVDLVLAGLLAEGAVATLGYAQTFYVLRVLDSDKKIMIPVQKVDDVGLQDGALADHQGLRDGEGGERRDGEGVEESGGESGHGWDAPVGLEHDVRAVSRRVVLGGLASAGTIRQVPSPARKNQRRSLAPMARG